MDNGVLIALIGGLAVILAGIIGILPSLRRRKVGSKLTELNPEQTSTMVPQGEPRRVYYKGNLLRFLNFGGKRSRVQPVEGGESLLVPTHELYHDKEELIPITRDSIVVRS